LTRFATDGHNPRVSADVRTSFIGLDVGGTFLKGARVDGAGRIGARLHEPVAKDGSESLVRQFEGAVRSLDPKAEAEAIGIGLPGIVEHGSSRVRVCPNLPALNGFALGKEMASRTGRAAFLENDANAAALAEAWLGAGRGAQNLMLVTLGTGIGGGILLNGRVWPGVSGFAGELGHIQVDRDGVACGCGSWGCVETIAGVGGWTRRAEALLASRDSSLRGKPLDPQQIVAAAKEGDSVALEVIEGTASALSVGIAAALLLLNLDRIVIGGGVSAAGDFILDRIAGETRRRVFPQVAADCTFSLAELGGDAGVVGAARVAMVGLAG
jgi:glucokinase